ncbi:MAG: trimethylamine methyltransferase family protein [Elusimicrobia bacterium]|nr:trimethylamine methyltransferase family protein [Elusimicrobiota bacterium]
MIKPINSLPQFSLLSEDEIKKLHLAALEVLQRVGVVFQHEKALDILSSIGCKIEKKNIVKIPAHLVEESIRNSPPSVHIYDRKGLLKMKLEDKNVYFGAGLTCPNLIEIDGTRKPYTSIECEKNSRIADALENIDFTMAMAHISDVPNEVRDVHEIYCVLKNSVKPIIITSHDHKSLETIVDICSIISSSKENFLTKPYLIYYTEPVSPLQHTTHSLEKLFKAVDYGLPILNTPAPMAGGTAPITLTGTLLSGLAELLSGLVLIQNYKKGTPVIFGGVFTTLDMRDMIFTYGSPELQLMNTAIAQIARHYRIPSFGTAGVTDAHEVDEQASFECASSIIFNILSGSNLVHDVGWISSASGTSNELLVFCNEIIDYARHYMSGINTNNLEKSINELMEVGPGGKFIDRELTFELFKSEIWYPKLMSRNPYEKWKSTGKTSFKTRLKNETNKIIQEHQPIVIENDKKLEIENLIKLYDNQRMKQ